LLRIRKCGSNILIVGDQNIGASLQSSILKDSSHRFKVSGFITLEEKRIGSTINATPIIGTPKDIPAIVKDKDIEYIFIALDSASNAQMKKVIKISQNTGVLTRITPGVVDLVNGKFSLNDLREIKFEDYLDRKPVKFDLSILRGEFYQKSILVTGAGGSIGSSLCEELLSFSPSKLIALDLSENNLFNVSRRLRETSSKSGTNQTEMIYKIVDIKDKVLLDRLLEINPVDYIIHAAALKHVPFSEENALMAVETNVCGTLNLLLCTNKFKIKKFIYISTDKAVEPISIMGATKRIGELLIKSFSIGEHTNTKFMAVRFGNVIGSSGNVVEIITEQLQKRSNITITDPKMERYFMSLEEAAKLIMEAIAIGENGEIFVLDMGKPVKIVDLARDIALFYGRQLGNEDIIYIGKRKAEKLNEKLFGRTEVKVETSLNKIFKVEEKVNIKGLLEKITKLCENIGSYDDTQIREVIFSIINGQNKD